MDIEKSGKVAANIRQLIAELERQVKEQSHENTTEFRVVITHEGAQVSQITSGAEYLRSKGLTAINLRGEQIV
jgi:uncharacterized protein with ACT and thioredoxin-like domain